MWQFRIVLSHRGLCFLKAYKVCGNPKETGTCDLEQPDYQRII
jgi:hypothetical protein